MTDKPADVVFPTPAGSGGTMDASVLKQEQDDWKKHYDEMQKYKVMSNEEKVAYWPTVANTYNTASASHALGWEFRINQYESQRQQIMLDKVLDYQKAVNDRWYSTNYTDIATQWQKEQTGKLNFAKVATIATFIPKEINSSITSMMNVLPDNYKQAAGAFLGDVYTDVYNAFDAINTANNPDIQKQKEFEATAAAEGYNSIQEFTSGFSDTKAPLSDIPKWLGSGLNTIRTGALVAEQELKKWEPLGFLFNNLEGFGSAAMIGLGMPSSYAERAIFTGAMMTGITEKPLADLTGAEIYQLSKIGWSTAMTKDKEYAAPWERTQDYLANEAVLARSRTKGIQADMILRIRSGEDPNSVAMSLGDPVLEFLGQFVVDPLNFVGYVTKPFTTAFEIGKANKIFKATGALDDLAEAQKLSNAFEIVQATGKAAKTTAEIEDALKVGGAVAEANRVTAEAAKLSGQLGDDVKMFEWIKPLEGTKTPKVLSRLFGNSSMARTSKTMQNVSVIGNAIFGDGAALKLPKDMQVGRAQELLLSLAYVYGPKADDLKHYNLALKTLMESPQADVFLSPGAANVGVILSDMLVDDAGKITLSKVNSLTKTITDLAKAPDASVKLAQSMEDFIKDEFPDISARLAYEAKAEALKAAGKSIPRQLASFAANPVAQWERNGYKAFKTVRKYGYDWWMPFMSRMWTKANPPYWTRNFVQGTIQNFYDGGIGTIFRNSNREYARMAKMGFLNMRGISGISSVTDIAKGASEAQGGGLLFKAAKKLGMTESDLGMRIFATGVDEGIEHMRTRGFWFAPDDMLPKNLDKSIVADIKNAASETMDPHGVLNDLFHGNRRLSLGSVVKDSQKVDTMKKFNLWEPLQEGIETRNILDDDWVAMFKKEYRKIINEGKNPGHSFIPSDNMSSTAKSYLADIKSLVDSGGMKEPHPALMARIWQAEGTFDQVAFTVKQVSDEAVLHVHNAGTDAVKSVQKLTNEYNERLATIQRACNSERDAVNRLRLTEHWDDATWFAKREEVFGKYKYQQWYLYNGGAIDGQVVKGYLSEMQELLNKYDKKLGNHLELDNRFRLAIDRSRNLMGTSALLDTYDDVMLARGVSPLGEGGSTVMNIMSRYPDIPTGRRGKDGAFIGFEWSDIQRGLKKAGVDLPVEKISNRLLLTAEEEAAVDAACKKWSDTLRSIDPTSNYAKTIERQEKIEKYMLIHPDDPDVKILEQGKWKEGGVGAPTEEVTTTIQNERRAAMDAAREEILKRIDDDPKLIILEPDDGTQTGPYFMASQEEKVNRIIDETVENARKYVHEADLADPVKYADDDMKAAYQWADATKKRMDEAKPIISAYAAHKRDFAHLFYEDKRGFDMLLSNIYPFHYWYSRTYLNWIKRAVLNPWGLAAYSKYRGLMEKLHAGMPDWWKFQLNTNEMFGLNMENPLYFNLESFWNPLYGMTGPDFNDPDRRKTWWSALLDDLGKFGPSVHVPLMWAAGLAFELQGDREAASSWIQRVFPQTQAIKSITTLLGIDPSKILGTQRFGVGGLEIDPGVVLMGGTTKWDIKATHRELTALEQEGKYSHEAVIDAAYAQSGPIWDEAARRQAQRTAPSRLLASFAGPGWKSRTRTDMQVDMFYQEMNTLYTLQPRMAPERRREAWNALFEKYPFASSLLLARKSGQERDEALCWEVLRRIPPGQSGKYAKAFGIDEKVIDRFYEVGLAGMNEDEAMYLMSNIRIMGSVMAMPETAIRKEWNAAHTKYSAIFSTVPDSVVRSVDAYYTALNISQDEGLKYINSHPEVAEYLDWRAQVISNDPLLMKYYGGIKFLEGYYDRIISTAASARWPGIDELVLAYQDVKKNGGDTKGFITQYPQLREYWDFVDAQRARMKNFLASISSKIPESPSGFWRTDINAASEKAQEAFRNMQEQQSSADIAVNSLAVPFIGSGDQNTPDFNLTEFLNTEAEKRWPGITESMNAYKAAAAKSPGLASAYLVEHPEVAEYIKWDKEMRKRYNASVAGKKSGSGAELRVMTWADWAGVFSTPTRRLLEDYFRTGTMPDNLRASITRTLSAAGITDVDSWLQQMAASVTAPA